MSLVVISKSPIVDRSFILYILIGIGIRTIFRLIFNVYFELSPITGVRMMAKLFITTLFSYTIHYLVFLLFFNDSSSVAAINDIILIGLLSIVESVGLIVYRYWRRILKSMTYTNKNRNNTIIIGAGEGAHIVVEEILNNKKYNNHIIGFLDDNHLKVKRFYMGYKILGTTEDAERIIREKEVEEVIISTPQYTNERLATLVNLSHKMHFKIKKINVLSDNEASGIKELSIDELLNRAPVKFDRQEIDSFLLDKVVLVTGAGGSIGSELCRQIIAAKPETLILFDIYENSTYDIQLELLKKVNGSGINIVTIIGSTYNEKRVDALFKKYKPNIIFHAAAYKHVPLMEDSPNEAIRTNIIGTYNIASAAHKYGAQKMVLVSTDKAVRPTNVMGATKRYAELIIHHFSALSKTAYSAVRFGNVLGSNGSVVPLFRKQIEEGGPITVTHPDINRFFMTIPEAVSLILQSGVYAKKGEIFILDMGEPVKIAHLAEQMIIQAGLKPYVHIDIVFTGLRPGEKLYEELLLNKEEHKKTPNDKIFIEEAKAPIAIDESLKTLKTVIDEKENGEIKKVLASLVSTYTIQD